MMKWVKGSGGDEAGQRLWSALWVIKWVKGSGVLCDCE